MRTSKIENRLAYAAALIVLIGVSAAASSVLAAEISDESSKVAARRNMVDETLIGARKANAEAAAEAAESLKNENMLDLDIQLEDLTSTLIADAK